MRSITFAALAVICTFWLAACSSGGGTTLPKDLTEAGDASDILMGDTCDCTTDSQCTGKADACHIGKCKDCHCIAEAKPKGTTCDDKDPKTVSDACDENGQCHGKLASCHTGGNTTCDSPIENCENCPEDCPCGADQECIKGKGVCKKVVCGDNLCEGKETCGSCAKDCLCKAGETCWDGACTACADYCKKAEKQCGQSKGCDCGQCPNGGKCTELNTCIQQKVCGNGACETGETCKTCPKDCGCKAGQTCGASEKCEDCVPICKAASIECGDHQGCQCGSCPVCYKCSEGKCKPKSKDCVCYKKQCGQVAGFTCGQCQAGYDCVQYKCLQGCDTLCEGKACGWSGSGPDACFCNWCDGCDACHGNKCESGAAIDKYDVPPYNDVPDNSVDLGKYTDSSDMDQLTGTIDIDFDADWYKLHVDDTAFANLTVEVWLEGIAEDKDIVLEVCYKCDNGTVGSATDVQPADMVMESDTQITGARCWTSFGTFGESEYIRLVPACSEGVNDSGTVWMHVFPATGYDCGSGYTLKWQL